MIKQNVTKINPDFIRRLDDSNILIRSHQIDEGAVLSEHLADESVKWNHLEEPLRKRLLPEKEGIADALENTSEQPSYSNPFITRNEVLSFKKYIAPPFDHDVPDYSGYVDGTISIRSTDGLVYVKKKNGGWSPAYGDHCLLYGYNENKDYLHINEQEKRSLLEIIDDFYNREKPENKKFKILNKIFKNVLNNQVMTFIHEDLNDANYVRQVKVYINTLVPEIMHGDGFYGNGIFFHSKRSNLVYFGLNDLYDSPNHFGEKGNDVIRFKKENDWDSRKYIGTKINYEGNSYSVVESRNFAGSLWENKFSSNFESSTPNFVSNMEMGGGRGYLGLIDQYDIRQKSILTNINQSERYVFSYDVLPDGQGYSYVVMKDINSCIAGIAKDLYGKEPQKHINWFVRKHNSSGAPQDVLLSDSSMFSSQSGQSISSQFEFIKSKMVFRTGTLNGNPHVFRKIIIFGKMIISPSSSKNIIYISEDLGNSNIFDKEKSYISIVLNEFEIPQTGSWLDWQDFVPESVDIQVIGNGTSYATAVVLLIGNGEVRYICLNDNNTQSSFSGKILNGYRIKASAGQRTLEILANTSDRGSIWNHYTFYLGNLHPETPSFASNLFLLCMRKNGVVNCLEKNVAINIIPDIKNGTGEIISILKFDDKQGNALIALIKRVDYFSDSGEIISEFKFDRSDITGKSLFLFGEYSNFLFFSYDGTLHFSEIVFSFSEDGEEIYDFKTPSIKVPPRYSSLLSASSSLGRVCYQSDNSGDSNYHSWLMKKTMVVKENHTSFDDFEYQDLDVLFVTRNDKNSFLFEVKKPIQMCSNFGENTYNYSEAIRIISQVGDSGRHNNFWPGSSIDSFSIGGKDFIVLYGGMYSSSSGGSKYLRAISVRNKNSIKSFEMTDQTSLANGLTSSGFHGSAVLCDKDHDRVFLYRLGGIGRVDNHIFNGAISLIDHVPFGCLDRITMHGFDSENPRVFNIVKTENLTETKYFNFNKRGLAPGQELPPGEIAPVITFPTMFFQYDSGNSLWSLFIVNMPYVSIMRENVLGGLASVNTSQSAFRAGPVMKGKYLNPEGTPVYPAGIGTATAVCQFNDSNFNVDFADIGDNSLKPTKTIVVFYGGSCIDNGNDDLYVMSFNNNFTGKDIYQKVSVFGNLRPEKRKFASLSFAGAKRGNEGRILFYMTGGKNKEGKILGDIWVLELWQEKYSETSSFYGKWSCLQEDTIFSPIGENWAMRGCKQADSSIYDPQNPSSFNNRNVFLVGGYKKYTPQEGLGLFYNVKMPKQLCFGDNLDICSLSKNLCGSNSPLDSYCISSPIDISKVTRISLGLKYFCDYFSDEFDIYLGIGFDNMKNIWYWDGNSFKGEIPPSELYKYKTSTIENFSTGIGRYPFVRGIFPFNYSSKFIYLVASIVPRNSNCRVKISDITFGTKFINENDVIQLASGANHVIALKGNNSIQIWGTSGSEYQEVFDNIPTGNNFAKISSGYYHAVALGFDNRIYAWGTGGEGTVPLGDPSGVFYRGQITGTPSESDFVDVSCGGYFNVALKMNGEVYFWGSVDSQTMGNPCFSIDSNNILIFDNASGEENDFIKISAGGYHVLGIKENGLIRAAGEDEHGQVSWASTLPSDKKYIDIAAGKFHSVALDSDGFVYSSEGEEDIPTSIQGHVKAVYAGNNATIAVKNDGTIVSWGTPFSSFPNEDDKFYGISMGDNYFVGILPNGAVKKFGDNTGIVINSSPSFSGSGEEIVWQEVSNGVHVDICLVSPYSVAIKNISGDTSHVKIVVSGFDNTLDEVITVE